MKKKSVNMVRNENIKNFKNTLSNLEPNKSQIIKLNTLIRRNSTFNKIENNIKLNTWQILKYLFCLKFHKIKNRITYLDCFYDIISVNFDLIFLIKSQAEYEMFKTILLEKEQNDILTISYKKCYEKKLNVKNYFIIGLSIRI